MAGKRLLDLTALFDASRGVVQKHIALRRRHLDVYNRTSTLARAVRHQTDRITETAKAASFLASRLNESAPAWTSEAAGESPAARTKDGESIPRKDYAEGRASHSQQKEGLEQDHFYDKSESNSTTDREPTEDLEIRQEQADRHPLPDGTIPPAESDINTPVVGPDSVYTRLKDETVKEPLENGGLKTVSPGASSQPSPLSRSLSSETAKRMQRESEAQIPSKTADALDGASVDPLEEGHDEESFYRTSGHTSPTLSSLPRVKIPKHPSSTQRSDADGLNSDTFYDAEQSRTPERIPSAKAVPEQEQLPEGINTDLFYSRKIARMLGVRKVGSNETDLKLKGIKTTPMEHTGLAEGKDQDTFNVRNSSQTFPTIPEVTSDTTGGAQNLADGNEDIKNVARDSSSTSIKKEVGLNVQSNPYELRESKVPSSRLGRLWNYGGLAAGMFGGALSESIRRVSGSGGEGSFMLSAGNMDRLVTKLSRMRGAALKLGQMMSFQDSKMLPAPIQEVLQRVQDRADYMPASQRNKVLSANLGPDWRELFSSFDEKPLAAASIGQVHKATLKSNGAPVAVKVQYPGVADSIDSDLNNLAVLLTASRLLPKGLFLDKTIANAQTELAWECDYIREAECGRQFGKLLADETEVFVVPKVYPEASGRQVLTMEFMGGIGVTRVHSFTQDQRDWIGTQILRLCLREITEFKYMQTDPNWTNFLYNAKTNKLELLDFGASREYPEEFITLYSKNLVAASKTDKESVRKYSIELGYLTGDESKAMLDAHIASVLTLAEPFLDSSPEVYDFQDQTITDRVKALIPIMIRERLAPPPEETYSLHRKLSGAFLLCARLGSRVRCRELFQKSMTKAGLL